MFLSPPAFFCNTGFLVEPFLVVNFTKFGFNTCFSSYVLLFILCSLIDLRKLGMGFAIEKAATSIVAKRE